MDSYVAPADQNIAASPGATLAGVVASTLTRGMLVEIIAGVGGTPADEVIRWLVRRFTAAGTASAVVGAPEDPAAPAAQLTAGSNHTVEPTYAGVALLDVDVHQRQQLIWRPREVNKGFLIPATAANGIGVTPIHATATNLVNGTIAWRE